MEWVALWPIFEVCAKETGYSGRGEVKRAMVATGVFRATTVGHVEKYFGRSRGAAATRV